MRTIETAPQAKDTMLAQGMIQEFIREAAEDPISPITVIGMLETFSIRRHDARISILKMMDQGMIRLNWNREIQTVPTSSASQRSAQPQIG